MNRHVYWRTTKQETTQDEHGVPLVKTWQEPSDGVWFDKTAEFMAAFMDELQFLNRELDAV